jgi:hypothetical protein
MLFTKYIQIYNYIDKFINIYKYINIMLFPYKLQQKKDIQDIENDKNTCSYCNTIIDTKKTIYFAYDHNFCSDKCRHKFVPPCKFSDIYIK